MSEELCGRCGLPIHPSETRRYFGSHVAHLEDRCLYLLQNEIATLRADLARVTEELSPPPFSRWVAVSDVLVKMMGTGAWGDPVQVRIERADDRVLQLAFKRYDATAALAAQRERWVQLVNGILRCADCSEDGITSCPRHLNEYRALMPAPTTEAT